jgi:hypothetical protein
LREMPLARPARNTPHASTSACLMSRIIRQPCA